MSTAIVNPARVRAQNPATPQPGPVIYWMSRDQRVHHNWALLHASAIARERRVPLAIVFTLVPSFLGATLRQYDFMLRGLKEIEETAQTKNIPLFVLNGDPTKTLLSFIREENVGTIVTDFSPLRIHRTWKNAVARQAKIPLIEVDAHNIVPVWIASPKREYGAYTLRPKIAKLLPTFLEPVPLTPKHPIAWPKPVSRIPWSKLEASLRVNTTIRPVDWITPGEHAAARSAKRFIDSKLSAYDKTRNDPAQDGQSNLSPYLHFGHLSPQQLAWDVRTSHGKTVAGKAFLEELIIRRELADNFCFYEPHYDTVAAFPAWATETLAKHRKDTREHRYSLEEFERGETHDPLWNAAEREMVMRGKMHGYMRMYWAKKILEWTQSPEEAMRIAIHLNDTYELDGRDPNGYAGIAWSIGGVHDRPWFDRPVFGSIRYMSYNGAAGKFDIHQYILQTQRYT